MIKTGRRHLPGAWPVTLMGSSEHHQPERTLRGSPTVSYVTASSRPPVGPPAHFWEKEHPPPRM